MHETDWTRKTTYTSASFVDASFARMSRDITKLVLASLNMRGDRYGLWDHMLDGLFFFASFDGNGQWRHGRVGVRHDKKFVVFLSRCFRTGRKSEPTRRPDAVIVDVVVNVHGFRLGQVLLRRLPKLCDPARRIV